MLLIRFALNSGYSEHKLKISEAKLLHILIAQFDIISSINLNDSVSYKGSILPSKLKGSLLIMGLKNNSAL